MTAELPRLRRDDTALLLVDIQDRLAAAMQREVREALVHNTQVLLAVAKALRVPVLVTEQYPKGLGTTVSELRSELGNGVAPLAKVEFDCTAAPGFQERLKATGARQVILVGMETHVCILQTVQGLREAGLTVWVANDAVASREKHNWKTGLALCERAGALVASTETLAFMLLGRAGTPEFKTVSALLK